MKQKTFAALVCAALLLTSVLTFAACDGSAPFSVKLKSGVTSDSLYVKKVENLSDDFVMGMDVSSVLAEEASGVKYYNFDGEEEDVFKILADNGINTIRVRVWNDPYTADGESYGGGNCDIDTAIEIGKRATQYGMNLMVDFHYSDFWADPNKQQAPKAWADMKVSEKRVALHDYTAECLNKLKSAGVKISMVQIGNETNGSFCGETSWRMIANMMKEGAAAVREVCPKALVVLHFANPEKAGRYKDYADELADLEVDYDVFASSYYPYWHGTLENLSEVLSYVAKTYDKKVMVAETSYAYTTEDSDFGGNTISGGTYNYPFTVQGQANSMRDIINCIANTTNGIGVCYWEGAWISAGGESWEENSALWETYGSGWASSAAAEYDSDVASYGGGGSMVDNQTFFDKNGNVLESLKVFALVKNGNEIENKQDTVENIEVSFDIEQNITIPTQTNAVMISGDKVAVDVDWGKTDAEWEAEIEKMKAGGIDQTYSYTGKVGDKSISLTINIIAKNFVTNGDFESDDNLTQQPTGWTVTENGTSKADQLYVEENSDDSLDGTKHFHFWANGTNRIDFNLEQQVEGLTTGKYKFSIAVMGNATDCGNYTIYSYVKINGEIVQQASLEITVWGSTEDYWDSEWISFDVDEGDEVVVGIYVKCAGNNAWGKIDCATLNVDSEE